MICTMRTKKYVDSRNIAVIGRTGGGKTVDLEKIVGDYHYDTSAGYVNIIIDCGGSYEKAARLYDSSEVFIFRYVSDEPLGLDPFAVADTDDAEHVDDICETLWLVIKPGGVATSEERVSLRKDRQGVPEDHACGVVAEFLRMGERQLRADPCEQRDSQRLFRRPAVRAQRQRVECRGVFMRTSSRRATTLRRACEASVFDLRIGEHPPESPTAEYRRTPDRYSHPHAGMGTTRETRLYHL